MAKWHSIKSKKPNETKGDQEFLRQGPLVSIGREPPQNSTDNPFPDDGSKPVIIKYKRMLLKDEEKIRKYLPKNDWYDHITAGKNKSVCPLDVESYEELVKNGLEVLLIEDYNTTGLSGDTQQILPTPIPGSDDEYDENSKSNTYLWFMRAVGETMPKGGRGGSWGLGKLAIPLSSKVRTFFCVTTQRDTKKRFFSGQTHIKRHYVRGESFDGILYYAEDKVLKEDNEHSWLPISSNDAIDEFCDAFDVDRPSDKSGTSFVIPLPHDDEIDGCSNLKNIALCVLANYTVPILDGKLEVHFVDGVSRKESQLKSSNIDDFLNSSAFDWDGQPQRRNDETNPAWSSKARMKELIELHKAEIHPDPNVAIVNLENTSSAKAPNNQNDWIFPEDDSKEMVDARDAFHRGDFIKVTGRLAVKSIEAHSGVEHGDYSVIFRKCEDEEAAEAHFYRDQISLPLVNKKGPVIKGVSSLVRISGEDNPLANMLRQSEGPAHLKWEKSEYRLKQYHFGPSTISFLRDIVKVFVAKFHHTNPESESLWSHIFSRVSVTGDPQKKRGGASDSPRDPTEINPRNFSISNSPSKFTISNRNGGENLSGREFIIRVGYPKPRPLNVNKPPDKRSIDVLQTDNWIFSGAEIRFDVAARNGEICPDRVRLTVHKQEFEVTYNGMDERKRGQLCINKPTKGE